MLAKTKGGCFIRIIMAFTPTAFFNFITLSPLYSQGLSPELSYALTHVTATVHGHTPKEIFGRSVSSILDYVAKYIDKLKLLLYCTSLFPAGEQNGSKVHTIDYVPVLLVPTA